MATFRPIDPFESSTYSTFLPMHFFERPPSSTWELVPLADAPHCCLWAWFKPPAAPQGVFVRIPEEAFRDPARRQPISLRGLLQTIGVDSQLVSVWTLYGTAYDAQLLANPAWDCPLPEPGASPDPSIGIYLKVLPAPAPAPAAPPTAGRMQGPLEQVFARMEADWYASLQIEQQVDAAAKQLNATLMRVNSLNRDMSPEEARGSDSQDKRDWQEARRWLRDVAARVSRFLKDHTVGMTSNAGKRHGFETIYKQHVAPRVPVEGLEQAEREFEAYRKSLQNLLNNMTSANSSAVQDGERRAQQVITRVAAKIRNSRSKRG
ncbi:MAG: hypothetical protein HY290_15215 [Planctomycetia bacterium]|nr:hypothetical protein [Planctomycetia bacterium]